VPRTPESGNRYRTKAQVCKDVAHVLNAPLHYATKYAVLDDACWKWSEFSGKFKGCTYWSKAASEYIGATSGLRHEHLVPKKVVIAHLLALDPATTDNVHAILDRYCIGVVVTKDEDARLTGLGLRSKMPDGWDAGDPWARYAAAGIEVIKPG